MLRNAGIGGGTEMIAKQKAYADQANAIGQYIPPTRRQQLEQQKEQLNHALAKIDAALAALDAHPDLEEFAETLSRAGV